MNPHDILGTDPLDSKEEIKKKYRARAKETHPDLNGGEDEEFKKVNEAYKQLLLAADPDEMAHIWIRNKFKELLRERPDIDYFQVLRKKCVFEKNQVIKNLNSVHNYMSHLENLAEKIQYDFYQEIINKEIVDNKKLLLKIEEDIKIFETVYEKIKDLRMVEEDMQFLDLEGFR